MSPRHCPKCHADLRGAAIPAKDAHLFAHGGGDTEQQYFSRCIGYEDPYIYDGTIAWICPDCDHRWARNGMERFFDQIT